MAVKRSAVGPSPQEAPSSGAPRKPSRGAAESCPHCAVLEAKLAQAEADFTRLVAAFAGNAPPVVETVPPAPPQDAKPLPKSVLRALVTHFPGRTSERAAHETMARELVEAGMAEAEIARMLDEGRPIDL